MTTAVMLADLLENPCTTLLESSEPQWDCFYLDLTGFGAQLSSDGPRKDLWFGDLKARSVSDPSPIHLKLPSYEGYNDLSRKNIGKINTVIRNGSLATPPGKKAGFPYGASPGTKNGPLPANSLVQSMPPPSHQVSTRTSARKSSEVDTIHLPNTPASSNGWPHCTPGVTGPATPSQTSTPAWSHLHTSTVTPVVHSAGQSGLSGRTPSSRFTPSPLDKSGSLCQQQVLAAGSQSQGTSNTYKAGAAFTTKSNGSVASGASERGDIQNSPARKRARPDADEPSKPPVIVGRSGRVRRAPTVFIAETSSQANIRNGLRRPAGSRGKEEPGTSSHGCDSDRESGMSGASRKKQKSRAHREPSVEVVGESSRHEHASHEESCTHMQPEASVPAVVPAEMLIEDPESEYAAEVEEDTPVYGMDAVGRRLSVYWPADDAWYDGTIKAYDPSTREHIVVYDDGDQEALNISRETVVFMDIIETSDPKPSPKPRLELKKGTHVWAKVRGHGYWPGVFSGELNKATDSVRVNFFDNSHAWCEVDETFEFASKYDEFASSKTKATFQTAVEAALESYQKYLKKLRKRSNVTAH